MKKTTGKNYTIQSYNSDTGNKNMKPTPRHWEVYCHRIPSDHHPSGYYHANFGDKRWVKLHDLDHPIVPVTLTEDTEGEYYGWNDKPNKAPGMVQCTKGVFSMQFPYGLAIAVKKEPGKIIRMRMTDGHST